jgi:Zn-dependent protease with chaperone function
MKKDKIIYWTTTGIVCAVMLFSAINFSLNRPLGPGAGSFAHLGLPNYFKIELTVAKILGVLALLIPNIPTKTKEFAYFGFGITLISASIAHFASGDGIPFIIDPLLFLGALIVSYWYFNKIKSDQNILLHSSGLRSGR